MTKWTRVHFEPEPNRKYLVWWNTTQIEPEPNRKYLVWWSTTQKGRFAIGEYRWDVDEVGYVWTANGSRKLGKLIEFWAELPAKPSRND